MTPLRIAVIGAGRLGGFHAQKLAATPNVKLVAVVDPSQAACTRVASQCNTIGLSDHRWLLGEIDAAVIASPTVLHHAIAMDLLAARIHVLVEKPICTTVAEAEELVETARQQQLVLQVGHVERFNPAVGAATPHTRGRKYIEAVRAGAYSFRSMDVGVVLDLMIHDIDLVLSMVRSPVRQVEAMGIPVLGGHEDVANARLVFDSGCVASLSASRVASDSVRRMQIWAPRAYAGIDFNARTATIVRPSETLLRRQFHPEQLTPEQIEYYKTHLVEEHLPREERRFDAVDALALELHDFIEAILLPRQPRVTGEAGRDALAVAERILESIAEHAWGETPAEPAPAIFPRVVPAPHFSLSAIERKAG
jgi:predicted dehydrogenase